MRLAPLLIVAFAHAALPGEHELFVSLLARMDRNADERLSREEYTPYDSGGTFDSIDADRDSIVTVDELRAWVLVTEPRPMDRPLRSAAAILSGADAPSFAAQPIAATTEGNVADPAPTSPDRTLTRVLILGGMTLVAALIGAWMLWSPAARRRR